MCGLLFHLSKSGVNKKKFETSLLLQKHRGPDHTGIKQLNNNYLHYHDDFSVTSMDRMLSCISL